MLNTINTKVTKQQVVCARWYFTFDGEECKPPIDGVVYEGQKGNSHYPHQIGGFCQRTNSNDCKDTITSGNVDISFNIGDCNNRPRGVPYLGLDSVSRIIISEMPPPQD